MNLSRGNCSLSTHLLWLLINVMPRKLVVELLSMANDPVAVGISADSGNHYGPIRRFLLACEYQNQLSRRWPAPREDPERSYAYMLTSAIRLLPSEVVDVLEDWITNFEIAS